MATAVEEMQKAYLYDREYFGSATAASPRDDPCGVEAKMTGPHFMRTKFSRMATKESGDRFSRLIMEASTAKRLWKHVSYGVKLFAKEDVAWAGDDVPGIAVMIETTEAPSFDMVVGLTATRLPLGWEILILTDKKNSEWTQKHVQSLSNQIGSAGVRIHVLSVLPEKFTRASYSCLLLSTAFYEQLPSEHILIFQTDSLLLHDHHVEPYSQYRRLEDFYDYPFIGMGFRKFSASPY